MGDTCIGLSSPIRFVSPRIERSYCSSNHRCRMRRHRCARTRGTQRAATKGVSCRHARGVMLDVALGAALDRGA
jgi:hypothetical protein